MKLKIHQHGQGWEVRDESGEVLFASPLQSLCAIYVRERTAGKPLDCPRNCKYCSLVEKCKLHSAEYDVRTLPLSAGYVALVEKGDSEDTRVIGLHPAHGAPYGKPAGEEDAAIKEFLDEMLEHYRVNDPLMYRAWTGRRPGEPEGTPGPLDVGVEEYFKAIHPTDEQRAATDQFFAEMLEEMYRVNAMPETAHPTDSYAELLRPARIDLQFPIAIDNPHLQKSREEILADITTAIETIHAETPATPPLSLRQQIAAQLAINAQRYGTITATTDWDTSEGAIRLRFMKYRGCQIAVRMHNGGLTHLWLDGDLFYDAH